MARSRRGRPIRRRYWPRKVSRARAESFLDFGGAQKTSSFCQIRESAGNALTQAHHMKTNISPTAKPSPETGSESIRRAISRPPIPRRDERKASRDSRQCTMATHFESGQVIFRAGEPANGFYLIESGKVVLEEPHSDGEPMMIDVVSDGEPLGWSWLFCPISGNSMHAPSSLVAPCVCPASCCGNIAMKISFSATSFSNA